MCRALVGNLGARLGLFGGQPLDGPGQDPFVDDLGCLFAGASGARLTTNLELVRTRGI